MDASVNHSSWFLRMSEQALRVFAMGLVLTGQMLPAGAASAQDDPPSPSFAAPPARPVSGLTPVAVESPMKEEEAVAPQEVEENTVAPQPGEAAEEAMPPAAASEETPVTEETPAADEAPVEVPVAEEAPAAEPTPAVDEAATPTETDPEPAAPEPSAVEAEPAPHATTEEAPAPTLPAVQAGEVAAPAAVDSTDPTKYQIGEWTMTILPGPVPPKAIHEYRAPVGCEGAPMNQNNVSVPVNVTVNNTGSQGWPWASPWSTPWANANYWNSPTAAYLFQHPQPYWQLRQDFYHLRPFIRGL